MSFRELQTKRDREKDHTVKSKHEDSEKDVIAWPESVGQSSTGSSGKQSREPDLRKEAGRDANLSDPRSDASLQ